MKIRKEFKDGMKIWSGVLFIILVISCIYYSYCKFLIETLGLPSFRSNLKGDFEIMVSATFYTVAVYILIMLVIGIVKAVRRIVGYIFE